MGCCSPFSTRTHAGCNYSELGLSFFFFFFVGLPGRFVELWQEVERPSETGATQVEEMLFGMRLGFGWGLGCLCWSGEGCETCRVARRQLTMWKRCRLSCCRCCQSKSENWNPKGKGDPRSSQKGRGSLSGSKSYAEMRGGFCAGRCKLF